MSVGYGLHEDGYSAAACDSAEIRGLRSEVDRLRKKLAPSRTGTVRLLFNDGSHRDVPRTEPCAYIGEILAESVLQVRHMTGHRVVTAYGEACVENLCETLARVERQRDEALAEVARLRAEVQR